ncbi:MAG TPA: PDZ domain-containing protein [Candidatus Krumholzibacteria bacterium]|nr:PDZ domain-containing protein [Candidatus Krumholzibacteria bacterium]HPD73089.1 PDZ domain-containing protein [Candidatus Krumholzibacteria bacterium]HRY41889.1 PDZ domain-containing protein [Candidatus Krumholzibacteria bacterium]
MNRLRALWPAALLVCATAFAATPPPAPFAGAPTRLLRLADISAEHIVFTYEGDLWLVDQAGGIPRRLTTGHGAEQDAKFSPDGRQLAFTGQYDGANDVYVMPALGGEPRRLTFHPGGDQVIDWHPDGKRILFRSARRSPLGDPEFYLVDAAGGLPEKVAVDRGALGSYSPDGTKLAYNRIPSENRTWKRYQGGMAQDVWLADFTTGAIVKATDWTGADNYPMWIGDRVYFNSDREDGTLNLYSLDPAHPDQPPARLTRFDDFDVKYPSAGPGRIVFQYQEQLHVLDLASGEVSPVHVDLRSDRVQMRPEYVRCEPKSGSFGLDPAGETLLLEARGEIVRVPVEEGPWRNLTAASGSREKNAAWSPDGKEIAFVSDRTGQEQLYVMPAGGGEWRQLTDGAFGMMLPPVWSPDSKSILVGDKFMRLNLVDVASGKVRVIDQGEYDDAWERWGILDYVWSPDSRWIAYTKNTANMHEVVTLHDTKAAKSYPVTDAMFTSWSPSFDPAGRYLWFLSNRTFEPIMDRIDQNHIFLDCARPYLALLQDGARSPFDPAVDDAAADGDGGDDGGDDADKDDDDDDAEAAAVRVDPAGIADRVVAVKGCDAANWFRLEATAGGCLLLRRDEPVFLKYQHVDDRTTDQDLTLVSYSLEDEETEDLGDKVANYHLSADGETLVARAGAEYTVGAVGDPLKDGDAVDLSDVRLEIVRDLEYRQIFDEAWRVQRDWFYDRGMHGEDWDAVRAKYAPLVAWCGHRDDLRYLIGEMIGELNIGHTYIFGGDYQGGPGRIGTGLLGCDLELDAKAGRYRIARILPGWGWSESLVSPLTAPGVGVREGEYLLAVDGVDLAAGVNPYSALVDKAGNVVELAIGPADGKGARTVKVETLRSESGLRYRAWVEGNRRKVEEMSGGKLGYLHLPDMSEPGLSEFAWYWYPQTEKQGLVIDERSNGGGFVADMIIDRLERDLWSLTIPREGKAGRNPERDFHGPLAVLISEETGSNGEFFAQAIKDLGLARLIGMRTWGGAIGIEPHQDLVDGGTTTPPQFGLYSATTGRWIIEGWGVEPDDVVQNLPADVVAGNDAQLKAAVDYLLGELERNGERWRIPPVPAYPDKSKPKMSGIGR